MSSERVKKELYETAMTGEKALTSLMYVQMTLYAAKSQRNVRKGTRRGQSDDAPHRDPHESVFKGCRE